MNDDSPVRRRREQQAAAGAIGGAWCRPGGARPAARADCGVRDSPTSHDDDAITRLRIPRASDRAGQADAREQHEGRGEHADTAPKLLRK